MLCFVFDRFRVVGDCAASVGFGCTEPACCELVRPLSETREDGIGILAILVSMLER